MKIPKEIKFDPQFFTEFKGNFFPQISKEGYYKFLEKTKGEEGSLSNLQPGNGKLISVVKMASYSFLVVSIVRAFSQTPINWA